MTVEELVRQAEQLTFQEQLRLLKSLADMLQTQAAPPKLDWHTFVDATYGILADDPIERGPQGEYEERDALL